jgi:hypothetical protein
MPRPKKSEPVLTWAEKLDSIQDGCEESLKNYTASGYRVCPEGNFYAKETCELGTIPDGRIAIFREFVVLEGEHTNEICKDMLLFEKNDVGLSIAKTWVEMHINPDTGSIFEWPIKKLRNLETIIAKINEMACEVEIESKNVPSKTDKNKIYCNVTVHSIRGQDTENVPFNDVDFFNQESQTNERDQELIDLIVLCASHGIDGVDDTKTKDEIVEILSGLAFGPEDNLTVEECSLFVSVGLDGNITREPKKRGPKKINLPQTTVPSKMQPVPYVPKYGAGDTARVSQGKK